MSGEEGKELVHKENNKEEKVPDVYGDFVEDVAVRDIAQGHGVEPGKTARVFKRRVENGDEIHIVGDKEVVSGIGNTLEKGGYRVKEWHIRRPGGEKEIEKTGPDLERLLKHYENLGVAVDPEDGKIKPIQEVRAKRLKKEANVSKALQEFKEAKDKGKPESDKGGK